MLSGHPVIAMSRRHASTGSAFVRSRISCWRVGVASLWWTCSWMTSFRLGFGRRLKASAAPISLPGTRLMSNLKFCSANIIFWRRGWAAAMFLFSITGSHRGYRRLAWFAKCYRMVCLMLSHGLRMLSHGLMNVIAWFEPKTYLVNEIHIFGRIEADKGMKPIG